MILSDANLAVCLLAATCSYFAYNHSGTIIQRTLGYLEPTSITNADFNRFIKAPNPCANFKNIKLVFTLPTEDIASAIHK